MVFDPPPVAVAYDRRSEADAAAALADELGLPVAKGFRDPHDLHLLLAKSGRLELRVNAAGDPLAGGRNVAADLLGLDVSSPAGRKLGTPLFKAVGIRKGDAFRPHVIDATAGLGEDAWLLAAQGCRIDAVEANPVVHALLRDALRRAAEGGAAEIAERITLHRGRAQDVLAGRTADAVALDPMFPPGRKTAEKKPMKLLRRLAGDASDEASLFAAARATGARRVVVKRPRLAPPLVPEPEPTHRFIGKALRFDLYT